MSAAPAAIQLRRTVRKVSSRARKSRPRKTRYSPSAVTPSLSSVIRRARAGWRAGVAGGELGESIEPIVAVGLGMEHG